MVSSLLMCGIVAKLAMVVTSADDSDGESIITLFPVCKDLQVNRAINYG